MFTYLSVGTIQIEIELGRITTMPSRWNLETAPELTCQNHNETIDFESKSDERSLCDLSEIEQNG